MVLCVGGGGVEAQTIYLECCEYEYPVLKITGGSLNKVGAAGPNVGC